MFSFLTQCWQPQVRSGSGRRRRPTRRPAWRPRLEILEDRTVPSTIPVTKLGDDVTQQGTLRWAVANVQSGDTISIDAGLPHKGAIVLTQGELLLTTNLTILTEGPDPETISGDGRSLGGVQSRVFEVAAGAQVTLSNIALTGGDGVANNPSGNSSYDHAGGAIINFGTLTVSNCKLSGNAVIGVAGYFRSGCGGGIDNEKMLTVNNSTLSDNFAGGLGGGICNITSLQISGSTLEHNAAGYGGFGDGGGIYNNSFGMAQVNDCTLTDNSAGAYGGGLFNEGAGTLTVSNCTLSDNTAGLLGGGIYNSSGNPSPLGMLTVSNCNLSGNSAGILGGGIYNAGMLTMSGTTLSFNTPNNLETGPMYLDLGGNTFNGP
jgi:hypothetical protein